MIDGRRRMFYQWGWMISGRRWAIDHRRWTIQGRRRGAWRMRRRMGTIHRLNGEREQGHAGPDHEGTTISGSNRLFARYIHSRDHCSRDPSGPSLPQPEHHGVYGCHKTSRKFPPVILKKGTGGTAAAAKGRLEPAAPPSRISRAWALSDLYPANFVSARCDPV
jgi:hypothetical protein